MSNFVDSRIYEFFKYKGNREMLRHIMEMEQLIQDAQKVEINELPDVGDIQSISWLGMGASALIGEIIGHYLSNVIGESMNIKIFRTGFDPKALKSDLIIFYTYSGNTYETLNALTKTLSQTANKNIIVFSSGGKAEEIAKKHNIPHIKLIQGYVSRSHVPYGVSMAARIISDITGIKELKEFNIKGILREVLGENPIRTIKYFEVIARDLATKIPVFMIDYAIAPLLKRANAQFNENAKYFIIPFEVPEGAHNTIVGLRGIRNNLYILVIRRNSEDEFIRNYFELILNLVGDIPKYIFNINDEKLSWRTYFMGMLFIDILSVLLAEVRGVDSFDIREIVAIKEALNKD